MKIEDDIEILLKEKKALARAKKKELENWAADFLAQNGRAATATEMNDAMQSTNLEYNAAKKEYEELKTRRSGKKTKSSADVIKVLAPVRLPASMTDIAPSDVSPPSTSNRGTPIVVTAASFETLVGPLVEPANVFEVNGANDKISSVSPSDTLVLNEVAYDLRNQSTDEPGREKAEEPQNIQEGNESTDIVPSINRSNHSLFSSIEGATRSSLKAGMPSLILEGKSEDDDDDPCSDTTPLLAFSLAALRRGPRKLTNHSSSSEMPHGPQRRRSSVNVAFMRVASSFREKLVKKGVLPAIQVSKLVTAVKLIEPELTKILEGIALECGGRLVGLENRFKSGDSLLQKVGRDVSDANMKLLELRTKEATGAENLEIDLIGIVWGISDALRYTVEVETSRYTEAVLLALGRMKAKGAIAYSEKNYWGGGDPYQGVNDVFKVPCGLAPSRYVKVEVQFHTPESFAHKNLIHKMYEEFRSTLDPDKKIQIWRESVDLSNKIPSPIGVCDIPVLKTQVAPIAITLFCELVLVRAKRIETSARAAVRRACSEVETLPIPGSIQSPVNAEVIDFRTPLHSSILSLEDIRNQLEFNIRNMEDNRTDFFSQSDSESTSPSTKMLQLATLSVDDALTLTVVLPDEGYIEAVMIIRRQLFLPVIEGGGGFVEVKTLNGWLEPAGHGGLGIRCVVSLPGDDDGVAFTPDDAYPLVVVLHTARSFEVQKEMDVARSQFRTASCFTQHVKSLVKIKQLSRDIPIPFGVVDLTFDSSDVEPGGNALLPETDATSQLRLGVKYFQGDGVERSESQAAILFQSAAELGNVEAACMLGVMFDQGLGVNQSDSEAARWTRVAAEKSSVEAQFNLGLMCMSGKGVELNNEEAAIWFQRASAQGSDEARKNLEELLRNVSPDRQVSEKDADVDHFSRSNTSENDIAELHLQKGLSCLQGNEIEQNHATAAMWLKSAAERGNAEAAYRLGVMFDQGRGVEKSDVEAARWIQVAAEKAHSKAQSNLGVMFLLGKGVVKSHEVAFMWFRKASEQGNDEAQRNLDTLLVAKQAEERVDEKLNSMARKEVNEFVKNGHNPKFVEVSQSAGEESKETDVGRSQFELGVKHFQGLEFDQSDEQALTLFKSAAERGSVEAACILGTMYDRGRGVERSDLEAVKWTRIAAERMNPEAQFNLGLMYITGKGVEKDEMEAVRWFRRATEQGSVEAQCNLAAMLEQGRFSRQSSAETHLRQQLAVAAEDSSEAQYNLGLTYLLGRGVHRNDQEAARWLLKAANQGCIPAQYLIASMYKRGQGVEQNIDEADRWTVSATGGSNSMDQLGSAVRRRTADTEFTTPDFALTPKSSKVEPLAADDRVPLSSIEIVQKSPPSLELSMDEHLALLSRHWAFHRVRCEPSPLNRETMRFLIGEHDALEYRHFGCLPIFPPTFGYPGSNGKMCSNFDRLVSNNHPFISILAAHDLHPYSRRARRFVWACTFSVNVAATAVLYTYFIKRGSTLANPAVAGIVYAAKHVALLMYSFFMRELALIPLGRSSSVLPEGHASRQPYSDDAQLFCIGVPHIAILITGVGIVLLNGEVGFFDFFLGFGFSNHGARYVVGVLASEIALDFGWFIQAIPLFFAMYWSDRKSWFYVESKRLGKKTLKSNPNELRSSVEYHAQDDQSASSAQSQLPV